MGKNSLIKSTDKKKAKTKKKEDAAKTKTTSKSAPPSAKSTTKKPQSKKTTASTTAQKATNKKNEPKLTVKELIFKKFDPLPGKPEPLPAAGATVDIPAAPPVIISDDPKEVGRLRGLLNLQFSMEEIKAVAKEPEPAPEPKIPADVTRTSEPEKAKAETAPSEQTEPEAPRPAAAVQPEKPLQAQQPAADKASIDTGSETDFETEPDPVQRALKYGVVGFVVLVLLLIGASYKNSGKFFIETKQDAIDISRGRFSPMGKKHFILLHGVKLPETAKNTYTRKDIYPVICNYYLAKADALLDVKTFPDYESIKSYLHDAKGYAITKEMKAEISDRLNTIDRMTLMFKADIFIRKNTPESLEQASGYLKAAGKLTTDETQTEMILKRMAEIKDRQVALEAASEAAPEAAPEQTTPDQKDEQTETEHASE
jgi:hypothetical protein